MRRLPVAALSVALLAAWLPCARGALVEYRFNPDTQHIYARTDLATPWAAAEAEAVAAGAHLVTINNAAENNWIQAKYTGNNWIGLYDVADTTGQPDPPGDWRWISGSPVLYTRWGSGEPNGASEDHAAIRGDKFWNDLNGTTNSLRGIVEFPTTYQLSEYRYNPFTKHVYARTNSLSWAGAQLLARTVGADLVTINDAGENAWLQDHYSGDNWIGFQDVAPDGDPSDPPGVWQWVSGQPVTYTNWGSGEPNGATEDHATLRGDRYWNDLNGVTNSRRGIVEFDATLEVQQHLYNAATGKVYLKTNSTTWENAELLASAIGGHLATVRSAAENEYVAAATRGGWIGITDRSDEGNFTWVSGESSTYTNWNAGEPNGGTGENYGSMYSTGRWNDSSATATAQGIIELSGTHPVAEYKYNPATGHVYARTANSVNWPTGQLVARAVGGDLVSINDAAENTWVQSSYSGTGWIGLYDVADQTGLADPPGDWRWSNGDAVTYTNWGSGEPNGAAEDHATLRGDQFWNDWNGDTNSARAIIEFPDAVPGTTLTGMRFNPATNKVYALTPSATWRAAELIARVNNTHLTTVDDAAENQWLAANMTGGSTRWIGMTDEGHEGGWLWASGEGGAFDQPTWSGSSYHNWNHPNDGGSGSEPNGGTGENYAMIYATGLWNDSSATTQMQGIVEYQAKTPRWVYNPANGRWYAQTDQLTWPDAELQAQFWGAHLATVNDAAEDAWLVGTNRFANHWIGFNDEAQEGHWVWAAGDGGYWDGNVSGGTGTSYVHWRPNEPNNAGTGEDYAQIRTDGWNDYGTQYLNGVAEGGTDAVFASAQIVDGPTPGVRYVLLGLMTWTDAEAAAQALGGHLVTVRDQAENDFLQALARDVLGGEIWLGYNDVDSEGNWVWSSGLRTTFTNWNSGEPNNSGGVEDFAAMIRSTGRWNDVGPTAMYYAVVELVPEPSTFAMSGAGLLALAGLLVRRRKR